MGGHMNNKIIINTILHTKKKYRHHSLLAANMITYIPFDGFKTEQSNAKMVVRKCSTTNEILSLRGGGRNFLKMITQLII